MDFVWYKEGKKVEICASLFLPYIFLRLLNTFISKIIAINEGIKFYLLCVSSKKIIIFNYFLKLSYVLKFLC